MRGLLFVETLCISILLFKKKTINVYLKIYWISHLLKLKVLHGHGGKRFLYDNIIEENIHLYLSLHSIIECLVFLLLKFP